MFILVWLVASYGKVWWKERVKYQGAKFDESFFQENECYAVEKHDKSEKYKNILPKIKFNL